MSASIPKVSKVSSSISRVLGCNPSPMTLQGTNVYIIGNGRRKVMIDAGQRERPEFVQNLWRTLKMENAKVEHLILTHWHHDHTTGLQDLIPVFEELGQFPCVHKFRRLDAPDDPIPPEYSQQELTDGQEFTWDDHKIKALYTPGHATDHACLLLEQEKTVFCGDCLLGEGTGIFDDLHDYLQSLRRIMNVKPQRIMPGHGPVIEDAIDRVKYNIDHQLDREKKVYKFLKDRSPVPTSLSEIVQHMYRGLSASLQKQATSGIQLHLIKLEREKKVAKKYGKYFVPVSCPM